MNRLLHFLLALLIAVATFDPAVGSSAFSSGAPQSRIYLYAHGNPINGTDPSGHEFTVMGQNGVLANLGAITRFTTSVLRVANTAQNALEFVATLREVAAYTLSGEFRGLLQENLSSSLDVMGGVDIDEAIDSLLKQTDNLIFASAAEWGPYMLANSKQIERFVIYLPTVDGVPYREIDIRSSRRGKLGFALGFGAGRDTVSSRKRGRLTGVGIGLKGDRNESKQIWRMDYDREHDTSGAKDALYIKDAPFHYHVRRAPRGSK